MDQDILIAERSDEVRVIPLNDFLAALWRKRWMMLIVTLSTLR